ncbi:MAG: hypothetical protein ACAI43_06995 [Phycisphaerae bacterium]
MSNRIRAALAARPTPADLARARLAVDRALAQVDAILAKHGARPRDLAAPSRRAYDYFRSLQWDAVPTAASPTIPSKRRTTPPAHPARPRTPQVRWAGLGRLAEKLIARLARAPSPAELAEIRRAIQTTSGRIESTLRRQGVANDRLTPATREWRGWLAWMAEAENVAAYLAAVDRARAALTAARAVKPRPTETEFALEFRPMRFIYRMRHRGPVTHVMMPTPMVSFDAAAFADLADLVFGDSRTAKQRVVERMKSESYVDLFDEIEGLGGVVDATRGVAHDLADSFDRVNARYFAGQMPRPRLSWSRGLTRRKFGHYDHVRDWVMLSSTMDRPDVPAFVVDYVMYHELLHKHHGIRWSNGRGYAHTTAFYADEHKFENWQQGEEWIKRLARGE